MKNAVETQFDALLAAKPSQVYSFDPRRLGSKDRAIVALLRAEGLAGKTCLDVGPGTGRWLTFLAGEGAGPLAAADISAEALRRCAPLCAKTVKADLTRERLDFPDDAFDVTVSFEVLEHIPYPDNYVAELLRVTRPGGLLLMSAPNVVSLISRIRLVLGALPPAISHDPTHLRHYRQRDVAALFARFGQRPTFAATSFSLNPLDPKSRLRLPSCRLTASLDDSLLFSLRPEKPGRAAP
jgi:SAM-dependent methyltransferase